MKYRIGTDGGNYYFNPSNNTVTFDNIYIEDQAQIDLITNVMSNVIIYNFAVSGLGGTLAGNVLTLQYNCTAMESTDELQIIIDVPTPVVNQPDFIQTAPYPVSVDDPMFKDNAEISQSKDNAPLSKIFTEAMGQQPISNGIPVAIVNEQIFDYQTPLDSRFAPAINTILGGIVDTAQYHTVAVQINTGAGISGGVLSFEASNGIDSANSTWATVALFDQSAQTTLPVTSVTLAASTNRYFVGPVYFRYFRIRVSTAVAGGAVSVSSIFSSQAFTPSTNQVAQSTGNWSSNTAQFGGQNVVTAGVNGTQAVGGNIAPGVAQTTNPLVVGGVDAGGLTRRVLTDVTGNITAVGPNANTAIGSAPFLCQAVKGNNAYDMTELLAKILLQMQLVGYYLKELPQAINSNINFPDEISKFSMESDIENNTFS